MVKSNIISTAEIEGNTERGYQPATDVNTLTISYIIDALEKRGINSMPFANAPEFEALSSSLEAFERTIDDLPDNKLLKDI